MKINTKLAKYLNIKECPTSINCIFCNCLCKLLTKQYIEVIECDNISCDYNFNIKIYFSTNRSIISFIIDNIYVLINFPECKEANITMFGKDFTTFSTLQPFDFTNRSSLLLQIKTLFSIGVT